MEGKFIAYYRVSTVKQGSSGLGIDAQRKTVMDYLNGGNWNLLDEFCEVESGKNDDRVELNKAIEICQLKNAKMVVAKLDRLSRDVAFISTLMKSGVKFVVAEMPEMTELTIHIFAAMAEHERKMISDRTKKALEQAKKRGVKLGNPILKKGGKIAGSGDTTKAIQKRVQLADEYNQKMIRVIEDIVPQGVQLSYQAIADELNERSFTTRRGNVWGRMAVKRIMDKMN